MSSSPFLFFLYGEIRRGTEGGWKIKGSSTVCDKTRRKIEKRERRNENTVYSEKRRLTGKQRQRWFAKSQMFF
jgi:hypothetical protein